MAKLRPLCRKLQFQYLLDSYLFKAEPEEVMAWNAKGDDARFKEVPASTAAVLRFPGDRIASFICSFGAADRSAFEIVGSKGVVKVNRPVAVKQTDIAARLSLGQEIARPASTKVPQLVKAEPPAA